MTILRARLRPRQRASCSRNGASIRRYETFVASSVPQQYIYCASRFTPAVLCSRSRNLLEWSQRTVGALQNILRNVRWSRRGPGRPAWSRWGPGPARAVTSHRPNSNSGPGGSWPKGPGDPELEGGGRREEHPAGAEGGGVEQRVGRAAQRRRLPGVGRHVRERAGRTEARDCQPSVGHQ